MEQSARLLGRPYCLVSSAEAAARVGSGSDHCVKLRLPASALRNQAPAEGVYGARVWALGVPSSARGERVVLAGPESAVAEVLQDALVLRVSAATAQVAHSQGVKDGGERVLLLAELLRRAA